MQSNKEAVLAALKEMFISWPKRLIIRLTAILLFLLPLGVLHSTVGEEWTMNILGIAGILFCVWVVVDMLRD